MKEKAQKDLDNIELYGLLLHRHLAAVEQVSATITLEFWLPGGEAQRIHIRSSPAWNPPLEVVTLPLPDMIRRYGERHAFSMRGNHAHAVAKAA